MSSKSSGKPSEVAMWHALSGLPDNVTDEGLVVEASAGQRQQSEKAELRREIAALSEEGPEAVRYMARLAASYLLAGDTETARRWMARAREEGERLERETHERARETRKARAERG